jgi:hypothetical protein
MRSYHQMCATLHSERHLVASSVYIPQRPAYCPTRSVIASCSAHRVQLADSLCLFTQPPRIKSKDQAHDVIGNWSPTSCPSSWEILVQIVMDSVSWMSRCPMQLRNFRIAYSVQHSIMLLTIVNGKGKAIPLHAWKLCEATDIIKNATEELKRFTQIGIQECFQHLYSGWQQCIVAQRGKR